MQLAIRCAMEIVAAGGMGLGTRKIQGITLSL